MKESTRIKKVNYIYNNSYLTKEYINKLDEYELNVIYKNIKCGVVYGKILID